MVGRLADRAGRRALGFGVLAGFAVAAIAAYSTDGWLLAAWRPGAARPRD